MISTKSLEMFQIPGVLGVSANSTLNFFIPGLKQLRSLENVSHVICALPPGPLGVTKTTCEFVTPFNLQATQGGDVLQSAPSAKSQKLLWCPFADQGFEKSKTAGKYTKGYPMGAIVHYTAGARSGLQAGMAEQLKNGFTYFVIDKNGNIGQNFSLDTWGYHAGKSFHPDLGEYVHSKLVGIEIQVFGKLEKSGSQYKAWSGTIVPAEEVRVIEKQTDNQAPGSYQMYTKAQEEALFKLLKWLHDNNTEVFQYQYVLGHDEVSPGRKTDPGGSLSMTMPALRKKLGA
jgi:hypothetical protein